MHGLRLLVNLSMQNGGGGDDSPVQISGMSSVHMSISGPGIVPVTCLGTEEDIANRSDSALFTFTALDMSFLEAYNAMENFDQPVTLSVYVNGEKPANNNTEDVLGANAQPQAAFTFSPILLAKSSILNMSSDFFDGDGKRMMAIIKSHPSQYQEMVNAVGLPRGVQFACNSLDTQINALQKVLRDSSQMRADLKSSTVSEMCGLSVVEAFELKKEAMNNYFRVPCSDLGPVSQQTHACTESMLKSSAPESSGLLIDWTQAMAVNSLATRAHPKYFCTFLMQSILKATTTLWQADTGGLLPADESACSSLLGAFADTLVSTSSGAAVMHDQIFQETTRQSAASASYTSDTKVNGIDTHAVWKKSRRGGKFFVESSLCTSGDGESQLMSGVPYTVNRALQERAEIATGTRKTYSDMRVGPKEVHSDCEDFSFVTRSQMHILTQMTRLGVRENFALTAKEHEPWLQAHLPWLVRVGCALCQGDNGAGDSEAMFCEPGTALAPSRSGRTYTSTLGLATGAASGQSSGKFAEVRTRAEHYDAWTSGLGCGLLNGHSFTMGFDDVGDKRQTWTNGVHVLYPQHRVFGEQTAVVFDVTGSAALDDVVTCSFDSDSSKIRKQVTGMQNTTMWRSAANSLRNGLFAQFLQKKTGVVCAGAQVKNDTNPSGFLQHVIAAGDVTFYSSDHAPLSRPGNVATPLASVHSQAVPSFGLCLPITAQELEAIDRLLQIGLHPTPELPALKINRPYDMQHTGGRGVIAVVASLPDSSDAGVAAAADEVTRSLGGIGREVISSRAVLVHFNGE